MAEGYVAVTLELPIIKAHNIFSSIVQRTITTEYSDIFHYSNRHINIFIVNSSVQSPSRRYNRLKQFECNRMKSSTGPLEILATLENKGVPQKSSVGLNFLSATPGIKTSCRKNKKTLACYPFARAKKKIFFSTNFSITFSTYFYC